MSTEFTPLLSFAGGALIGVAALLLMATHGRIAGISGIVSRLLPPGIDRSSIIVSTAMIAGLILSVPLYRAVTGGLPSQTIVASIPVLAIAGLLVGLGAGVGNGCTSGHGVCGISRLSARSIVATITFLLTGVITVTLMRMAGV
jgi:uncharacterized membrane protein YedE/YeeE